MKDIQITKADLRARIATVPDVFWKLSEIDRAFVCKDYFCLRVLERVPEATMWRKPDGEEYFKRYRRATAAEMQSPPAPMIIWCKTGNTH